MTSFPIHLKLSQKWQRYSRVWFGTNGFPLPAVAASRTLAWREQPQSSWGSRRSSSPPPNGGTRRRDPQMRMKVIGLGHTSFDAREDKEKTNSWEKRRKRKENGKREEKREKIPKTSGNRGTFNRERLTESALVSSCGAPRMAESRKATIWHINTWN